jgi:predicted alpha/beta superfamily hydrolase
MIGSPRIRFTLLVLLLFGGCVDLAAQGDSLDITVGRKVRLFSKVLNEERECWVYTPRNYDHASSRYPVLYLLDGESHFLHAAGNVQYLSDASRIPQLIVVAITNVDRVRDFTPVHSLMSFTGKIDSALLATTGGGTRFLEFLRNELIPRIDSTYRTQPYRILMGHSLGGMFATYTLEAAPELFNAYIIISPAFYGGNASVLDSFPAFLRKHPGFTTAMFLAVGDEPHIKKGLATFVQELKDAAPPTFSWQYREFPDEDHASDPDVAVYYGLRFIYAPWWIDVSDPSAVGTYADLEKHFTMLSARYGYAIPIPENCVSGLGYNLLYSRKNIDEAIAVFRQNTRNYPASSNAENNLGEAYLVKGERDMAVRCFRKSLDLNPANERALRNLAKLDGSPRK